MGREGAAFQTWELARGPDDAAPTRLSAAWESAGSVSGVADRAAACGSCAAIHCEALGRSPAPLFLIRKNGAPNSTC